MSGHITVKYPISNINLRMKRRVKWNNIVFGRRPVGQRFAFICTQPAKRHGYDGRENGCDWCKHDDKSCHGHGNCRPEEKRTEGKFDARGRKSLAPSGVVHVRARRRRVSGRNAHGVRWVRYKPKMVCLVVKREKL